jgi:hypothetical protein
MTTPIVVNGDTSLILVNTRDLTDSQSAVVILSSINYPGRSVTIRDSLGYLSSPQNVVVSTQRGVLFADGTSSIRMTQPYSFLTVTSRDTSSWTLKNSFGFPQNQTIANADALTTESIVTSNIYAYNFVSTPYMNIDTLNVRSSCAVYGPSFISSLYVGPPLQSQPGYSMYVQGTFRNTGDVNIEGNVSVRGNISTGSNLFVLGNISTQGSFGIGGDVLTVGNVYVPNGYVITNSLDVRGPATIAGPANFYNTLSVSSNVTIQTSVTASTFTTSSIQLLSSLNFQEKSIAYRGDNLLFSDGIAVPGISSLDIIASNSIATSNLIVYNTINATNVSSILFNSTAILNSGGTLSISSIAANNASFSNSIYTDNLFTSSITGSTLYLTGNIYTQGAYINANSVRAETLSTGTLYVNTLQATEFTTNDLKVNSLDIASNLYIDHLSSFTASNLFINNTGGLISTASVNADLFVTGSTITNKSGMFYTQSGSIQFVSPTVQMNNLRVSTLITSSIQASTLTASQLTIGSRPTALGPSFLADTTLYTSTNVTITGGPGDYVTPFFISNVQPPGTLPGNPYTVEASFRLDFNGPQLPGYYATILGFNLYPNGELNSEISIRSINDTNTITTLYGVYGTNQSYSTPPNTGGISIPYPSQPSSFLHVVGTMYGNSAFSLQFQSRSNDNYVAINSNNIITINNGALRWPYSLNGTTIQNSLNDISTRSLYYYGGLNFASDPALKENIEYADLLHCYNVVETIPLRRYKYIDTYLSTFQQKDAHRIGFIATELEQIFPKSISYTQLHMDSGYQSTFRMIDTQQIEMAHIGATKMLINKVSSLYATMEEMRGQWISTSFVARR